MENPSRMEVNAAIERLLSDDVSPETWEDHARVIISFAHDLPYSSSLWVNDYRKKNSSHRVEGVAAGVGNVQIDTKKNSEEEVTLGLKKERVGKYKIWKNREGNCDSIQIQSFWKSDRGTQVGLSNEPPLYGLKFHKDTQEPYQFGIYVKKGIRLFFFIFTVALFQEILPHARPHELGGIVKIIKISFLISLCASIIVVAFGYFHK